MNIKIKQTENSYERVSDSVVTKLYNAHVGGNIPQELDSNSENVSLTGAISVNNAYEDEVSTLENAYPKLHISATNNYIRFLDLNLFNYLVAGGIGTQAGITSSLASTAELGTILKGKTDITSFNEFKYFIKANQNPSDNLFFRGCSGLTTVDLSECAKLTQYEFAESGITSVNAPLLSLVGTNVFDHCTGLTSVINLGTIITIPKGMFYYCSNLLSITIPNTCSIIGESAFMGACNDPNNLSSITGLNNVTIVNYRGFRECKRLSYSTNDLINITTISSLAFTSNNELYGELNLPNLTSASGNQTFAYCYKITKVICLGTISSIVQSMFAMGRSSLSLLTEVYIPYECTQLEQEAFNGCNNLTTIKQYNKSITQYQEGETPIFNKISRITVFGASCCGNSTNLVLDADDICNAVSIGNFAFGNTHLSGNIYFNNLVVIGLKSFLSTRIESIDFTNINSTSIPENICLTCNRLQSITIPSGITSIEDGAFSGCTALATITCKATTPPTIGTDSFKNVNSSNLIVYVPSGSESSYQSASGWSSFNIQTIST